MLAGVAAPLDAVRGTMRPRWPGPILSSALLLLALVAGPAGAQTPPAGVPRPGGAEDPGVTTAPVVVDGVTLFSVRGVSAFPADERAGGIAARIRAAAADRSLSIDSLRTVPGDRATEVMIGDRRIVSVLEADAAIEGVHREDLAKAFAARVRLAVEAYRRDRAPRTLLVGAASTLVATAALVALVLLLRRLGRHLREGLERRFNRRIEALEAQSFQIVQAERVRAMGHALLRGLRNLIVLALGYFYLSFVLSRFVWTRPTAVRLLGYVLTPFAIMGSALVDYLPNFIFLLILSVVARYLLKALSLAAAGIERGTIRLQGFDREWASPTYRIVRVAVIGFAAVVAYPYIPGSESAAFKGISIFFGVVFSLGASSVVGNMMAGYSLIYRRTFKVGDRVRIDSVVGDVAEMRLQVTHLRTVKNEDVVVPNSSILTSQVVNYSAYAASAGLILHTAVGIGYEIPWRQVEAMLLLAAGRTPGLRTAPAPFVLLTSLGDFAVTYELNVYCGDAHAMARVYTALHRNILDVFNEYGVQIMTPAYKGDPETPKVVPKARWHEAPAGPDAPPSSPPGPG